MIWEASGFLLKKQFHQFFLNDVQENANIPYAHQHSAADLEREGADLLPAERCHNGEADCPPAQPCRTEDPLGCDRGQQHRQSTHHTQRQKQFEIGVPLRFVHDKDGEDADKDGDAKYPITTTDNDHTATSTTSLIIVVAIITIASLAILIWQYRQEIGRWWHRLCNHTKQSAKPTATSANRLLDQSDKSNTDEWLDKLTDNNKKQ